MSEAVASTAETPAEQVARRIRGRLAEERISGTKMAMRIGMDQRAFSRRHSGITAWQIDEVAVVEIAAWRRSLTKSGRACSSCGASLESDGWCDSCGLFVDEPIRLVAAVADVVVDLEARRTGRAS